MTCVTSCVTCVTSRVTCVGVRERFGCCSAALCDRVPAGANETSVLSQRGWVPGGNFGNYYSLSTDVDAESESCSRPILRRIYTVSGSNFSLINAVYCITIHGEIFNINCSDIHNTELFLISFPWNAKLIFQSINFKMKWKIVTTLFLVVCMYILAMILYGNYEDTMIVVSNSWNIVCDMLSFIVFFLFFCLFFFIFIVCTLLLLCLLYISSPSLSLSFALLFCGEINFI